MMFGKIIRKRRAKRFGIQFRYEGFWPHYYWVMRDGICDGCKLVSPMFGPKTPSDVYPILISETHLHCYKLISKRKKPGDDWAGASPYEYVIEYHHSEPRLAAPKEQE